MTTLTNTCPGLQLTLSHAYQEFLFSLLAHNVFIAKIPFPCYHRLTIITSCLPKTESNTSVIYTRGQTNHADPPSVDNHQKTQDWCATWQEEAAFARVFIFRGRLMRKARIFMNYRNYIDIQHLHILYIISGNNCFTFVWIDKLSLKLHENMLLQNFWSSAKYSSSHPIFSRAIDAVRSGGLNIWPSTFLVVPMFQKFNFLPFELSFCAVRPFFLC